MSIEKKILLLGSGFVAFPCLNHLLKRPENRITVACRHLETSRKMAIDPRVTPIQLDIANAADLDTQVAAHDIVISLVPYLLHTVVIKACIKHKKNIVTTSYVSADMAKLHDSCVDAQITCFNEIGVDPGIDHLYAIKMIDHVHKNNGKITSFLSYCGGLPAPECSNNPLGYKFSWSSRGVLLALRNDAKYLENGQVKQVSGVELMDTAKPIYIYPAFAFLGYPNRDSTPYTTRYNIPECRDLIRGTLRYQGFPQFVKVLVQLGFLSDAPMDHLQANAAPIQWVSLLEFHHIKESLTLEIFACSIIKHHRHVRTKPCCKSHRKGKNPSSRPTKNHFWTPLARFVLLKPRRSQRNFARLSMCNYGC